VARTALLVGAVLLAAGGGALGYALTHRTARGAEMSADQNVAMASAIAMLDGDLREAHSRARERATTISQNSYLQNGLRTGDPATAQDQVKAGETKYVVRPGELVEVGMMTANGPFVLSRQPEGAPPSGVGGRSQSSAKLDADRVLIYEVVEVVDGGKPLGYVTVVQRTDLGAAFSKLAAAGLVGRLELGRDQAAIGGGLPDGAKSKEMPLQEANAKLVIALPRDDGPGALSMPLVGAGAAGAAIGLLVLIIGAMAGGRRATPPEPVTSGLAQAAVSPSQQTVGTNLGMQPTLAATGTPSLTPGGSPILNPSNLGAGAMIGRWEVLRRLGSGGMADVYLARAKGEAGFERLVAIKVMHAHLARNERAVDHFLDEAKLAARITHPNVVQIHDLGKIGADYVIVMEYVEGVDLERLLTSARQVNRLVPLDVALGILRRICDGLVAAHTAVDASGEPLGIIHRDVKSANVLVSKQGGVKVVDFGIAKAAKQSHLTMAGETKGTPSMMAPQQRVGDVVDVRADVYAAAAVGYEVLTGHAVNLDLAALAHLGVDNWPHLPRPSVMRPELPEELDAILLTAMAFDRTRRPASCAALEEQLEAVMKRHGLAVSDKDIARWAEAELRVLLPSQPGASQVLPAHV
jgi:hypothetical protein